MEKRRFQNKKYLLFAIVVIGMCLRPSITGLGSLLKLIKPDLGLSDTLAGLLTTIPMLMFAFFSSFVEIINKKAGTAVTLSSGFILIALGVVIRSYGGIIGLFLGTAVIGCGIACGNVLMPAVIKSTFPEKYGFVTALNSTGLAVSSAIASGINYPIAINYGLGWRLTLCLYALVAVLAVIIWFPVRNISIETANGEGKALLHNKTAWAVTLFLGLEALIFYSCSSWLSTILQYKGLDGETAGYFVSCFQLMGIPASFIIPTLAGIKKDQRLLSSVVIAVFLLGILLLIGAESKSLLLLSVFLAGFGCNGGFALSMAFIGFRTSKGSDAVALSSMSQSIGYVLASFGPIGMGYVSDRLGDWKPCLWIIVFLLVLLFLISLKAAKEGTV